MRSRARGGTEAGGGGCGRRRRGEDGVEDGLLVARDGLECHGWRRCKHWEGVGRFRGRARGLVGEVVALALRARLGGAARGRRWVVQVQERRGDGVELEELASEVGDDAVERGLPPGVDSFSLGGRADRTRRRAGRDDLRELRVADAHASSLAPARGFRVRG